MDYDPEYPVPFYKQRAIEKFFSLEAEYMATKGYYAQRSKEELREFAVCTIFTYWDWESEKVDAFIPYLAMNYFDRFCSRYQIPRIGESMPCNVELVATSCLSIAWKMRDNSSSHTQFLEDRDLKMDRRTVLEMELRILKGLNWRTRAVTPICFARFFLPLLSANEVFNRRTVNEIIIQSQDDVRFTEFKPSVIAASALLSASSFVYYSDFVLFKARIIGWGCIEMFDLLRCLELMAAMCNKKQIMTQTAEQEEIPAERRAGKEPMQGVSENEQGQQMNFRLKWAINWNLVFDWAFCRRRLW